uniref:Uncharacterized protein n=1 Tax=Anguilla anguilla TaxID=7936 RepID=A0A0E9QLE7_ANGAN
MQQRGKNGWLLWEQQRPASQTTGLRGRKSSRRAQRP